MATHFMIVHIIFSSVWFAEWPPFWKEVPLGGPYVLFRILTACNFSYLRAGIWF